MQNDNEGANRAEPENGKFAKSIMSFPTALAALRDGARVQRQGWNGKGMFLFIIERWTYTDGKQDNYPNQPFIAMKTADDSVVPWLASQTDMLALDWVVAGGHF